MSEPVSFLSLPTELRLDIYDYALYDSRELTIATVLDPHPNPHRPSYNIPGLPANHIPVLRSGFDASLLDFTPLAKQAWKFKPTPSTPASGAVTPLSTATTPAVATPGLAITNSYFAYQPAEHHVSNGSPQASPYSLLATSRAIRDELSDYLTRRPAEPLRLHVSFPYGVLVLEHMYPALLASTSELSIGGFFTGEWERRHKNAHPDQHETPPPFLSRGLQGQGGRVHDAGSPANNGPNPPNITHDTHLESTAALLSIIHKLRGPKTQALRSHVATVTVRSFTPIECGYGTTLEFDSSPSFVAMKAINQGIFDTWCWRGKGGTVWIVRMRPGGDGRAITNSWPSWMRDEQEDWIGLVSGVKDQGQVADWGITVVPS